MTEELPLVPPKREFSVDLLVDGSETVLRLVGECDVASAGSVVTLAASALDHPDVTDLVLDLSQLDFLDSSGIGALITVYSSAADSGVKTRIAGASLGVRRLFEMTGVAELFGTDADPEKGP